MRGSVSDGVTCQPIADTLLSSYISEMGNDYIASTYESIQGGSDLVKWFGTVPIFHDAEILSFSLDHAGPSRLVLHGWNMTNLVGTDGYFVLEKRAVVTFVLKEITDLQLEGFARQNVIDELCLSRVTPDSGFSCLDLQTESPVVFEILLEHCYGLSGYIRGRGVSVSFVPDPL